MRIIVTGSSGQVAQSLLHQGASSGANVVLLGRPHLDLAGPDDKITAALEEAHPNIIVSAAAYTQVDEAERNPELAYAINALGPATIARAAKKLDVPIIHLSTDYVFNGIKNGSYVEEDAPNPLNKYGQSKLAGERGVLGANPAATILRTAWVFSPFGTNFVKTMLLLSRTHDFLDVVADQRGNPTSALDLADAILAISHKLCRQSDERIRGIFHVAGRGEASWAELAEATFAASRSFGGDWCKVRPITTANYPRPAERPLDSRLDSGKLARACGIQLPSWEASLRRVVELLIPPLERKS